MTAAAAAAAASPPNVLRLYRNLLRAASQYPSVRRPAYISALKAEFRDGRAAAGADLDYRLKLGVMELSRLRVYAPSRDAAAPMRMTQERDFTIQL